MPSSHLARPDAPAQQRPAAAARRGHLPPAGVHPAGPGRRGHQDLPVPGPGPAAAGRRLPVGPGRGPRRGDPPGHRLPLADGALLLVPRRHRGARLDGPAPLAGLAPVRRRGRRALPPAHAGLARPTGGRRGRAPDGDGPGPLVGRGHGRGRAGLRPQPLRPGLRGPDLGHPAPLGRAPLADRPPGPGDPGRRLALPRRLRPGHPHHQQHQPDLGGPGRHRADPVAGLRRLDRPGGALAPGPGRGVAHGGPHRRGVPVVVRGPRRRGPVRHPDRPLHRDLPGGRRRLDDPGGGAGARLLVLLRQRQARPVDRPQHPLHAVRHPDLLRPAGLRLPVRRPHPVPVSPLLRHPDRGGHAGGRRRAPLRRPLGGGWPPGRVDQDRPRTGVPQHRPGPTAPGPRHLGPAGRRRGGPGPAPPPPVPPHRSGRRGARDRQPARHLGRPDGGPEPAPGRGPAQLLGGRRRVHRQPRRRHPGARAAGHRLRRLPVGQHRGPHHPGPDRPALRRPRADPPGHAGVGQPGQRHRPAAAGGHLRPRGPGPAGPADRRR